MKDVVKIFKALADPTRLRIMLLLSRRELCVCELMFILGMEQSRVSHHMRVLRDAGIAEDIREGRWIIYRVPEAARTLLGELFVGTLRERIEHSREASGDVRKLDSCMNENIRGRVCESPTRAEGQ
jgi:ArsR family transcriptional regulator, arsenate/arsenite/antimonite-responsive transcriptional repressor